MRNDQPVIVRRSEYQPPTFLVDEVALEFDLDPELTEVTTTLAVRRNPDGKATDRLQLDGEDLELMSLQVDGRPLKEGEPALDAILERPECQWIDHALEQRAQGYAIAHVVPEHLAEVRIPKLALNAKTEAAVKDRLIKEITYWDQRAEQLKLQEQAGKPNARLNSGEARKRADALQGRLHKRLEELKLEAQISPLPPNALGYEASASNGMRNSPARPYLSRRR